MLRSESDRSREWTTDVYLITILLVFLLFPGISGYGNITFSKYVFLLVATGAWLAALVFLSIRDKRGPGRLRAPQLAALAFLAAATLSWLCSPWRADALIGAGRCDGLLMLALYVLIFLGVSLLTRPKKLQAAAFAAGVTVCCAVAALQLFGLDPFRLFPAGYGYYDAGIDYSGTYLGTVGNTNVLDAVLCAGLPLFLSLYILGESPLFLLPLIPGYFVAVFSGGSGAMVAYAVCALALPPLLLTDASRLRRALRGAAVILCSAAAALCYHPDYVNRTLMPRFVLTPTGGAAAAAAVLCLIASLLPWGGFALSQRTLRRCFLALDAALILGALAFLWHYSGTTGTLYELREVLHGHVEDAYGSSRVLIWRRCLELFAERPLLGGGPGTLALRAGIEWSRYVPETGITLRSYVDNAHNVYLGYLVNCGVPGLAAYLALLGLTCCAAAGTRDSSMTAALSLGALCAAVHAFFGLGLFLSEPFFWVILGLLCAEKESICT